MIRPFADPAPEPTDVWGKIGAWFVEAGADAIAIAIIIVSCLVAAWLLKFVIRRVVRHIVVGAKTKANVDDTQALDRSPVVAMRVVQRTRTLGTILHGIVNVTIFVVALVLIVQAVNPDILGSLTLLTAAVGAGLGFGAQNIVRDVLNGIFIVAGDQLGIGDVVDLGLATGVVEHVSVRVTHVRDVNGTLWYVRNGEILRIGNMSMGWARVVVDLAIGLDADVDAVESRMLEVATDLMKDPKWRSRILERPETWGLESVGAESQVLRLVIRTRAAARDDVAQELLRRLQTAMADMDVSMPALDAVLLEGADGAHRVRGANPPKTRPTPIPHAGSARPTWRARKKQKAADATPQQPITKPNPTAGPKAKPERPSSPPAERQDPPQDGTS
ncbi:mechanosensitive ion channel family protein [Microbacterium sp. NC79]|uniref:mechanosensitive ion channel family protein n=1 Tax=Microbacterium sp. NC79 TaxID=2851009 RepID=UPI001C2C2C1D|nr:mechanosensitive ion channel domain-containing protein [Microbacterium sp. NC79]MBV0894737.1 mechanosensitive ion channel [Microbacterium sp. NC79]